MNDFLCIFLSLLPWAWTRIRHFGCHSFSVIHSFFCVFLRLSNYNIACSVVMSLSLLLEKVIFSSLVLSHPLTICTTVTFYIVLHYSNSSCGEGMYLQVLHTWLFDHAIIYLLPCASCCIIELRSHLQLHVYIFKIKGLIFFKLYYFYTLLHIATLIDIKIKRYSGVANEPHLLIVSYALLRGRGRIPRRAATKWQG